MTNGKLGVAGRVARYFINSKLTPLMVVFTVLLGAFAVLRNSRTLEGTKTFLKVTGKGSREIVLSGNDLRKTKTAYEADKDVSREAIRALNNIP